MYSVLAGDRTVPVRTVIMTAQTRTTRPPSDLLGGLAHDVYKLLDAAESARRYEEKRRSSVENE
jgi:hypothetical protein